MLLTVDDSIVFNTEILHRGGFLRCKVKGRDTWQNALVSFVDKHTIKALTFNGNAAAYLKIPVADVNAGLWELIYSEDLDDVYNTDTQEADTESDAG